LIGRTMETGKTKKSPKRRIPAEVKTAVAAGRDKKAEEVLVLDLRAASSFTDFFIIMSGNSTRQTSAIYEGIEEELRKKGLRPYGVEGAARGEWILMDYGSFVVHIFSKPARDYYRLEKLWGDAPKLTT
jgi:ribosome-associated protein